MVGVYVDDIIVSGKQGMRDEFFNQLKLKEFDSEMRID